MKTSDAYNLYQVLRRIQTETKSAPIKFGYAIALNLARLQDVVEAFETSRTALITATSTKDETGEPLVVEGQYQIADTATFNAGIQALQDSNVDVALVKVDLDSLPAELEPILVQVMLPMITEPA